MAFFYNILIHLFAFGVWVAALWNKKAKQFLAGRKQWRKNIRATLPAKKNKRYWFHCASLGEFEMARPVIEQLQIEFPQAEIVISFFSPSGYEMRKHFLCTGVFYLPYDTKKNARHWYKLVNPDVAIFVKYEFWLNFMTAGHAANCEIIGLGVLFREGQFFFEPWAAIWKEQIRKFSRIFVQNKSSLLLADEEELKNTVLAGDIRFDRVLDTVLHAETVQIIEDFKGDSPLLIGGSTWPEEEKHLFNYLSIKAWPLGWKWVLAPHDIGSKHIAELLDRFSDYYPIVYSKFRESETPQKHKILIIDNVGLLSRIYRYGNAAVIGGAWGKGLHNILEAAAFGMPVLFGPKHQKFPEAQEAIDAGFAFGVKDYNEFEIAFNRMLGNVEWRLEAGEKAKDFVKSNAGSVDVVMEYLRAQFPNSAQAIQNQAIG